MISYNTKTARLMLWKQRLKNFNDTDREPLKAHLLSLLSNPKYDPETRWQNFNTERAKLLGEEHNQGWSWTPHFNWLWTILYYLSFTLIKINPQPGSRLRQFLAEEPEIDIKEVTPDATTSISDEVNLTDDAFEHSLFFKPEEALADLHTRIERLKAPKSEYDPKEIEVAIERLDAIKLRLAPQVYRDYLDTLFTRAPRECLNHFYSVYLADLKSHPYEPHQAIEYYLMARTLLNVFVLRGKKIDDVEEINPILYDIQKLVILLSWKTKKDSDPLLALASVPKETSDAIDAIYSGKTSSSQKKTKRRDQETSLKDKILKELQDKMGEKRFQSKSRSYDFPHRVLADMYEELKVDNHPLLIQFVRLACENLLFAYVQGKGEGTWKEGYMSYDTLHFLVKNILNAWPQKFNFFNQDKGVLLNPYSHGSSFFVNYRLAEKITAEVLLQAAVVPAWGLDVALKCCKEYLKNKALEPQELDWILARVRHVYPELVEPLKYIFTEVKIHGTEQLAVWAKSTPSNSQSDQIIKAIENALEEAKSAGLNVEKQYKAYQEALQDFYNLLNHCQLSNEELTVASKELLPKLKLCIKDELYAQWKDQIKTLQRGAMKEQQLNSSHVPTSQGGIFTPKDKQPTGADTSSHSQGPEYH
ncbi:Uncharacterised protein [Legionella lansingensis]|uniref:Uncharacterized protein n=1 Tax=Legionella lansingensis TaxID=45067 RepID=A0A0W0VX34_9GAMM|nr:hypothetical protein [Legionella lansingensis]KTD24693.1 hypothetical protein Llan_0387 [Legionella lansingensis]SNV53442.1 Uncharacterised protein [Legionella lansingensis]